MKHIKKFEGNLTHQAMIVNAKMTKVDFTGGDDGIYALYIDGELEKYGDYYHHKIENWIEGFIDGVKWSGVNVIYNEIDCDEGWIRRTSEYGQNPPKLLEDALLPPSGEFTGYFAEETNELFGIENTIRSLRNQDELEAIEAYEFLLSKKYSNLESIEKKGKNQETTKTFTFKVREDVIKSEMKNFLLPIRTPGMTDYEIYINDKVLECSRKIARDIWNLCNKINKSLKF